MTTSVGLEWLRPDLDRCRALIADHKSPRRWTKSQQGRSELVTEIDVAVERLLIDAISQRVPDAAILSEESNPDPSALDHETCFVIDPIDGTEELAAERPGFGISIALFERGRPAAAVLDMPAHDRRFESVVDAGASLNGKAIHLSQVGALAEARLAVSATQYGMDSLRPFWDGVGAAGLIATPAFTPSLPPSWRENATPRSTCRYARTAPRSGTTRARRSSSRRRAAGSARQTAPICLRRCRLSTRAAG